MTTLSADLMAISDVTKKMGLQALATRLERAAWRAADQEDRLSRRETNSRPIVRRVPVLGRVS